jgi:C4-dicarboxylate transporter DctQ subunit
MAWLRKLDEYVIAVLLATMTAITFVQVIARYLFNFSFVWALELNTVLFAWLIFLGMSYGVRVGTHIGIDVLVKSVGPRAARVLSGAAALLCLVYALFLTVGAVIYLQKMYSIGIEMQDIPLPQWVPRLVLPLGFGLLAFRFCQALWAIVRGQTVQLVGDEAGDALNLRADGPQKAPGSP